MDDIEDPLGKISRQLSELNASANVPAVTSSDLNGQWTQFSGISTEAVQAPFRSLYSWDAMDAPDFSPLSLPLTTSLDSSPNHFNADSGIFGVHSDFPTRSQFEWHRINTPPEKFQVSGDLAGRLVDVSRSRVHNQSQSNSFHSPSHVFHYDSIGSSSNVPVHRQMSEPSTQYPFSDQGRLERHKLSSSSSSIGILSNKLTTRNAISDSTSEELAYGVPVKNSPNDKLFQTPSSFDPRFQPPIFPLKKHSSENVEQASGHILNASKDNMNYLQMQDNVNINFDLGTTIHKPTPNFFSTDGTQTEAARARLYGTANKQGHSFNSNKMSSSDCSNANQTQSKRQEMFSESSVFTDFSRPSYSDIAKTPKFGPVFGVKSDQSHAECSSRNVNVKTVKREEKPLNLSVKRTSSGSNFWLKSSQSGETDQPKVTPTSKYGLDNFGDQFLGYTNHSNSSESLTNVINNRRGSGCIVGSSASALDDIASREVKGHISEDYNSDHIQSVSSSTQKQPILNTNPAKPQLSSKPPSASVPPVSKESLFFDPRRIFQYKNTDKNRTHTQSSASGKSQGATAINPELSSSSSDTILNNGKPASSTSSSKLSSNARQHDYINNDLRDSSKLTNQTAAESGQGTNGGKIDEQHKQKEPRMGKKSGVRTNGMHFRTKRNASDSDRLAEETHDYGSNHQRQEPGLLPEIDREKIEELWSMIWDKLNHWGNLLVFSLLHLFIYVLGITLYVASGVIHLILLLVGKVWKLIKGKLFKGNFDTKEGAAWMSQDNLRRRVGLEENINLPSTGDEAMKRLLACKGKDPYSILGLRADSTDEDIKKYYRRQAFLVHPDKNQELGAEEAFKILGHAFEMIGEPAKRKQYDSHTQETNEAEAMREFAEMLSKLQTKIQEAANIMHCDNCGGKHRRVPVERPFYSARFCQRCNTRHPAKEGDVWAESTMLGFYWHYFALMEGHVFNITEWMKCHEEFFSHIKANSHAVMFKIATDGNRRNKHHQHGGPNLEDLINQLFKSSPTADGQRPSWGTAQPGTDNSWAQGGTTAASAAAAAAKKSRRKKKRH